MTVTPIKARPTLYKGIQMRSRLEADYAAWLDRCGTAWEYEKPAFAGPCGQWLPDFRLLDPDEPEAVYVEVKPASLMSSPISSIDAILAQMSIAWLSEPDATLVLEFWQYGQKQSGQIMALGSLRPWVFSGPGTPVMLWLGMGQAHMVEQQLKAGSCRHPLPTG